MFMLIYALCYLPGHIVPELLFRCVTLLPRATEILDFVRAGKFSLLPSSPSFESTIFSRARSPVTRQIFTRRFLSFENAE